ncbi:putative plant galacturonosyltransferase GAUT [Helianthus annuus]|nr:putative plant galacturonosyltransferase GAUT [Helianthus annuus]
MISAGDPDAKGHNDVTKRNDVQPQERRVMDKKIKEMKDQLIRAKAYLSFALPLGNTHLIKELRLRVKELERAMGDVGKDSDLSKRLLIHSFASICLANEVGQVR